MIESGRRRNEGLVLMWVVVLIATLSVFLSALLSGWRQLHEQARRERDDAVALALAEAGVDRAIWELRRTPDWPGVEKAQLGAGEYTVQVIVPKDRDAERRIRSTGIVGRGKQYASRQTVEARVRFRVVEGKGAAVEWKAWTRVRPRIVYSKEEAK